jgi:AraC-like DNA-binding protein/ligand-binding sensor protein
MICAAFSVSGERIVAAVSARAGAHDREPAGDSMESCSADRVAVVRNLQQSALFLDYQQAFEATIGLPLVLRAAGSFRPPMEGSKQMNPFCALMRLANSTCSACLQLQQRNEGNAARAASTLECFAGLVETSVPVRIGDHVVAYLQTGQVFLRPPKKSRRKTVAAMMTGAGGGAGIRGWEPVYLRTRRIAPAQYEMIVRLLSIFAEHLSVVSNRMLIARSMADTPWVAKMRAYIAAHYGEPICLHDAARVVSMSPFYFCKQFKGAVGLTFTGYLARVRIEKVKDMLLNADRRVSEAAFAAGFQSLSQFNRVFLRVTGEAPTRYRLRVLHNGAKPVRATVPVAARLQRSG